MKKNIIFIVFLMLVFLLLYLFSTEEIVPVPDDREHAGLNEEECMDCHGVGREREHPPKFQCLRCHTLQEPDRK
jgi:hypothetical protein